jgi:hypothetical protein
MKYKRYINNKFFILIIVYSIFSIQTFAEKIAEIREQIQEDLSDSRFSQGFSELIIMTDEMELSGARYELDDSSENSSNTKLKVIALPFHKQFSPWKDARTVIYTEGVIGHGKASDKTTDIYLGMHPGLETSVEDTWSTFGGLLGIGPEFIVNDELKLAFIINGGISYIKSDTDYSGPGADTSQKIFDKILFNWSGWTATWGGSIRFNWLHAIGRDYKFQLVGRYNIRWTDTIDSDNRIQEFTDRIQPITLRSDLVGPTGLTFFKRKLYWRALVGYRYFLEGSLFGASQTILLGGGLEYDISDIIPLANRLNTRFGVVLGDGISGYTIGIGLGF